MNVDDRSQESQGQESQGQESQGQESQGQESQGQESQGQESQEIEIGLSPAAEPVEEPERHTPQGTKAAEMLDRILDMSESDLLPWENITLPSEGYYYGNAIPGGVVRIRAMGAQADKILATQRLAQTGQSIDYLFKHCVSLPNDFDSGELLMGDRMFLLYVLRGITHGNIYEFLLACPNCEISSTYSYDLNELANTIKRPDHELGHEPIKVVLPYMSEKMKNDVWVGIRFLRGKDILALTSRQKFTKRLSPSAHSRHGTISNVEIDNTSIENLSLIVDNFMGDATDQHKIEALLNKLHSSDTAAIRQFINDRAPGIDATIELKCESCGTDIKTDLPITESFFRPT